jgi:hypothetical protein
MGRKKGPEKVRHAFYISPWLHEWLWRKRVATGRDVSDIGEELMRAQIDTAEDQTAETTVKSS